jgi:hypothetical protein
MALKWTKTSLDPSEGAMKPKPLSSLNHFTVPVAITVISGEIERVYVQPNVERFQEKLPRRTREELPKHYKKTLHGAQSP